MSPAYEGWEEDAQGNKYFLFGYMNRNWLEEIDVPVGPENGFNIGGADQDSPRASCRGGTASSSVSRLPRDFTDKDELIWTLTTKGKTERAYATLRLDYKVDDIVKASETGALGAGTSSPEVRANKPPAVKVQGNEDVTREGREPLTIVADADRRRHAEVATARADRRGGASNASPPRRDARRVATSSQNPVSAQPRAAPPARVTVGKNVGLHLSWFVYRGAGQVIFDPEQIVAWEDTRTGANSPWAPMWAAPDMPADGKMRCIRPSPSRARTRCAPAPTTARCSETTSHGHRHEVARPFPDIGADYANDRDPHRVRACHRGGARRVAPWADPPRVGGRQAVRRHPGGDHRDGVRSALTRAGFMWRCGRTPR